MKNITTFNLDELERFDKIWCLVSGGIDSTYLFELISERYPEKTYPVNCWNPYEQSKTLRILKQHSLYIEVRPATQLDYKKILDESFMKIPKAIAARKAGKYEKKMFPCCKFIKHEAFKSDPLFQTPNTTVISGIKSGDGQIRGYFLKDLRHPPKHHNYASEIKQGFFHMHKEGQLYCYPFRDYRKRELPHQIFTRLTLKYPELDHSGCSICPVLVVFADRIDDSRVINSIKYWHKLCGQQTMEAFL